MEVNNIKDEKDYLNRKTERPKSSKSIGKNKLKKFKKESKKIKLQSIQKYKEQKIKEWNERTNENFDLKKFVKSYDIHNDSQFKYLNSIFEKKSEFISHYEKYQFILNIESRKQLEKKITKEIEFMNRPMIKNNILGDSFSTIKEILIKILKEIIVIKNDNTDLINTLKNLFKSNHIYFDNLFDFLIPTKFSDTIEYKYNKLILDVVHFFFPWEGVLENVNFDEDDKDLITERLSLFKELTYFINKINLFEEEGELIDICEFLFNLLQIMEEVKLNQRDNVLFKIIITTCYPFELTVAKNKLKEMKNSIFTGLIIDNMNITEFNEEELKEDSIIKFISKTGREAIAKASEVNWYLGDFLLSYFEGDNFMVCFSFKKCLNMNYIRMDTEINEAFSNLFDKMIKSKIVKDSMLRDIEADKFEYPFDYDDIINECKESIYFTPFPVSGLYGYSDKCSFKIFIYSNFSINSIKIIFTEYDNILKTKMHEFKHITRLYYHLFDITIKISTPKTKINKNNKDNNTKYLLGKNQNLLENKMKKIEESYDYRKVSYTKLDSVDYGDIFELFFVGIKSSKFFLANSIFFLKESSWNLSPDIFFKKYNESIKVDKIFIAKSKNYFFINSVINYFKLFNYDGKYIKNDMTIKDPNKQVSENNDSNYFPNEYIDKETISHCNFKKLLEKKK